jgi:outer membrane protein assembly factor BamB
MPEETLEDVLRNLTRNFHSGLAELQLLELGRDLCRELARVHAETPPRHPDLDPSAIPTEGGRVRLGGGGPTQGDSPFDLFQVGCLLTGLALGREPDLSWRLDGPPQPPVSTAAARSALRGLTAADGDSRFASAVAAAEAFEAALAPPLDPEAPWPMFRGGASRSGARPGAVLPSRLEPVWDLRAGGVVSSPVLGRSSCWALTDDGRLLFVDRLAGRLQLSLPGGGVRVESSPALVGRLLVFGTDAGDLVTVDVVAGEEVRRVGLGQMVRSSPLACGELTIVGTIEPKGVGSACALEAATGKIRWRRRLAPVFSSAAAAERLVVVGTDEGTLVALDLDSGEVRWTATLGGKVRATPSLDAGRAIVGDFSGRVAAVSLQDGTLLWSRELGHQLYSSPCLAAGLCVCGCNEGHIHGLDAATGEPRFAIQTRGPVIGSAVSLGDRFVAGATDGSLYLFDSTGQLLDRHSLATGGIASSPAVDQDLLVVGSAAGLHALRAVP